MIREGVGDGGISWSGSEVTTIGAWNLRGKVPEEPEGSWRVKVRFSRFTDGCGSCIFVG